MLGITIVSIAKTSPYASSATGYVDHPSGANTGSGNAVGLPDDTSLPYALLRDPQHGPRVTAAIRASQSTRANQNRGSAEETTVTLVRRPMGFDVLAPLIGRQVAGQEAVLWETGTLNGVSYTLASPKIWRRGPVSDWNLGTEQATLTIQAAQTGLSEQAMDKWPGFGTGLLFAAGGSGKVDWEVWDPSGDWTFSCYALLSQEQWDSTGGTVGFCMGNSDTNIRFKGKHVEAKITHATSGAQTIISDNLPRPERWYMLRVTYNDTTKVFSLYIAKTLGASELVGTVTGVGARTTSGTAWRFGQSTSATNNYEGIIGEFRFFADDLTPDDADGLEQGPLPVDAESLYAYLPGWTNIAGTSLLDFAQKNASSPRDGTITTATAATLAGGSIRETSDATEEGTGAGEDRMAWPLGKCTHILGRMLDAENNVFGFCDPTRGVQDFLEVYQGGIAETITFRETSWLAFYAATLVSAGDCVVYPQGGASRHHTLLSGTTTTGGSITADVLGHGPHVRGLKLDGSTQYGDAGTGSNSVFDNSFTIVIGVGYSPTNDASISILDNRSSAGGIQILDAIDPVDTAFRVVDVRLYNSLTPFISMTHRYAVIPHLAFELVWTADRSGGGPAYTWDSSLYLNGLVSSNVTPTGAITTSLNSLYLGRNVAGTIFFDGVVSELQIYNTAKDATWVADKLHENIAPYLDSGEAAVDLSGGLVALPLDGNPFVPGDSVIIAGTTNYDATEVLQTDPDPGQVGKRIVITATYNAETFDGTSTVKPSDLIHHYPGHKHEFPASTLTDEVGSLDFTLTGSPDWVGGVTPTLPRGQIAHVAKFAGQVGHKIDLTGAADWPSYPVDHVAKRG